MTENINKTQNTEDEYKQDTDALIQLKQQADSLNLKYHPSIGIEKLQEKVTECQKEMETSLKIRKPKPIKHLTSSERKLLHQTTKRKEATRLVRVRLTCMNPNKKNWPGEFFTIGNAVVGTVKKFVPFEAEAGYHIPYIIYTHLKKKKYQKLTVIKLPRGRIKTKSTMLPEFNITLLDPLTSEELDDLATKQAVNRSIGEG